MPQGPIGVRVANNSSQAVPTWATAYPPPGMAWLGYEKIPDLSSVQVLTLPEGAQAAMIMGEAGNVRYLFEDDPDGDTGMPLWGTGTLYLTEDLGSYRFINMTDSDAKLNVAYFG